MRTPPFGTQEEERGASAVEYGLLVAAIALAIVGVVFGLGTVVSQTFEQTCAAIASQVNPGCNPPATGPTQVDPGTTVSPGPLDQVPPPGQ